MLPLLSTLSLNDTGVKSFAAELKERQDAAKKAASAFKERGDGVQKQPSKPKPASKPASKRSKSAGGSSDPLPPVPRDAPYDPLKEYIPSPSPPREVDPRSMQQVLADILRKQKESMKPRPAAAPPSPYVPNPSDEDSPIREDREDRELTPEDSRRLWLDFQQQKRANAEKAAAMERRKSEMEEKAADELKGAREESGVLTLEERKKAAREARERERAGQEPVRGPDADDLEDEMFNFQLPPPALNDAIGK
jgi:hypothetical protein